MELIFIGWYVAGIGGSALMWLDAVHEPYSKAKFFCPTPKIIVLCLLGGIFGPIILITGILTTLISGNVGRDTWWNKPICK